MLAVGTFWRVDGNVNAFAQSGATNLENTVSYTQNDPGDQLETVATANNGGSVSGDGGVAISITQAESHAIPPLSVGLAAPFVSTIYSESRTASGDAASATGGGGSTVTSVLAYEPDPQYSEDLQFHGHLFLSVHGGFILSGSAEINGQQIVRASNSVYINGVFVAGIGAEFDHVENEWSYSGYVPGIGSVSGTSVDDLNLHYPFAVPFDEEQEVTISATSQGGFQVLAAGGTVELLASAESAAWVYATGVGAPPTLGDFDRDNDVDSDDWKIWRDGDPRADTPDPITGNYDGIIDEDDFDIWAANQTGSIIVSTIADESDGNYSSGDLSLREALLLAGDFNHPGNDTIIFAPNVSTITLAYDGPDGGTTPDQLSTTNVHILGPGADLLTISGGNQTRVLSATQSTVEGVTITGGNAGGAYYGGGIYGENLVVTESRITGNTASVGGGIFGQGSLKLISSEVSDNVATSFGGGIALWSSTDGYQKEIVNSTISGNTAGNASFGQGGGVFSYLHHGWVGDLTFQITNSTITDNTAKHGGGVYSCYYSLYGPNPYSLKIRNTIIAGNHDFSANPNDVAGADFDSSSSHNLIGYDPNGIVPSGNSNIRGTSSAIDPKLASLDFNGGSTKTHALHYDSQAIDSGDNDVADDYDLVFDQRGRFFPRKRGTVDIGAYESEGGAGGSGAMKAMVSRDTAVEQISADRLSAERSSSPPFWNDHAIATQVSDRQSLGSVVNRAVFVGSSDQNLMILLGRHRSALDNRFDTDELHERQSSPSKSDVHDVFFELFDVEIYAGH